MTPVAVLSPEQLEELVRRAVEPLRAEVASLRAALPPPALVTLEEAARLAGVSPATMRRRVKAGEVPAIRVGRSVRIDPAVVRPLAEAKVLELVHEARFPR